VKRKTTLLKKAKSHQRIKQMKRTNMKQNLLNPLNPLTILGFFRGVTNAFPINLSAIRGICPFVAFVFKNCPVVRSVFEVDNLQNRRILYVRSEIASPNDG